MSFNKMKIKTKILLSFLMIVLIGVAALGLTVSNTMRISNSAKEIAEKTSISNRLMEIQHAFSAKSVAERDFLLTGDPAFLELREGLEAEVDEHLALAVEAAAGHEHELLQELRTQLQDEESFHEVEELFNENKREEAILLYARINYGASYSEDFQPSTLPASHGEEPNGSAVEASHGEEPKVSVVAASPGEESHDASTLDVDDVISGILRDSDQRQRTSVITSVIAAVLAVAFALAAGLFLSRKITGPILQLRDIANKVSLGDLNFTDTVNAQDEIGELSDSFERMVTAIRFLVAEGRETEEEKAHATV
jgi:HAMP domain-containing protein/CHASE3 domain sensor protein